MPARLKLPDRRAAEIVEFDLDGVAYRAQVARFSDGRIAELFLDAGKVGSAAAIAARDGAIITSLALQHGDVVEHLAQKMDQDAALEWEAAAVLLSLATDLPPQEFIAAVKKPAGGADEG